MKMKKTARKYNYGEPKKENNKKIRNGKTPGTDINSANK